eukprot:EW708592.1.p3 GENE.EW708592.1~~EW708592.1.p3  ORF type:complete len:79 (-),score=11.76 EW708592.1:87-323(-)
MVADGGILVTRAALTTEIGISISDRDDSLVNSGTRALRQQMERSTKTTTSTGSSTELLESVDTIRDRIGVTAQGETVR